MEKDPWYSKLSGPFREWEGPVGIKDDGGGCTRPRGKVGKMEVHRAVNNRDKNGAQIPSLKRARMHAPLPGIRITRHRHPLRLYARKSFF